MSSKRPGKPGGVRDRNRQMRLKQLQEAALKLFLEFGIEAVTIDEIVLEANLAKGSFYRYFSDKRNLVESIFAPLSEQMESAFVQCESAIQASGDQAGLTAAYQGLAEQLAFPILQSSDVVLLYLQENRSPSGPVRDLADRITAKAVELTRIAHERKLLRPFEGRVSARVVVGAVETLLFSHFSGQEVGNPLEVPEQLISLVLDGLRPSRG